MQKNIRVTIDVTYETSGAEVQEIKDNLADWVVYSIDKGEFESDTSASLIVYSFDVEEVDA